MTLIVTGTTFTTQTGNEGLTGSNIVINWGDGTTEPLTSNTEFPIHTYSTEGTYTIQIRGEITSINAQCFKSCSSLTSISIPNSVTSIGNSSVSNCSNLTSISIPNSVTSIGNFCFSSSYSLTSISIPNSVTSIGTSCFQSCRKLNDYQLYWDNPPITWGNYLMPNNTNTHYTIPYGTTANYVAKSFPSTKLIERSA